MSKPLLLRSQRSDRRCIGVLHMMMGKVALRGGFEPPTPWFVAKYSIQLSYRSAEAGHILSGLSESNT